MVNDFRDVLIEEDTTIMIQEQRVVGDYEVLRQVWAWDGIWAESIIFRTSEVSAIADEDLKELCGSFLGYGSSTTVSRGKDYSFVNGNFKTPTG